MEETKGNSTRHIYMDVIRIIGCVLVVFVHISAVDWEVFPVTGFEWKVMNIVNSLGMSGVPLFFMISGALFLREDSNLTIKYVWKKIGMIFLFYLFCLFFYNLLPFIKGWEPWELSYLKVDLLGNVLKGNGIYHLWFLPVLIALYAVSPVLKKAFATKKNCEYFLLLFAIFGTTIPLLLRYNWESREYLQSFQDRFALYWLTGQIGYFVLGHYLQDYAGKLKGKKMLIAEAVGILTMLFIFGCNYFDAVSKKAPTTNASTPMSITCFIFVCSVFMVTKSAMDGFDSEKGKRILKYLSSLTLGIYFIHPFIIENVLWRIGLNAVISNYAVLTIARSVIVLLVSGMVAAILKKIPFIKKIF